MTTDQDDTSLEARSRRRHPIWRAIGQIGRYGIVGALVTGTDYSLYLLMVHAGLEPVNANAVSRVLATCVGALLHRFYTFAGPQRLNWLRQMMAYGLLSAVNLLLSTGLIYLLHDHMGWAPLYAKLATDVVITIISLVAGRLFIFAPAPQVPHLPANDRRISGEQP